MRKVPVPGARSNINSTPWGGPSGNAVDVLLLSVFESTGTFVFDSEVVVEAGTLLDVSFTPGFATET